MPPFEPVGDRPRWQVVYELLRQTETNDVLTYDTMGAALGLHPDADRHPIQMAMRRAAREHEQVDKRAVEAVPNKGYRVVRPPEHMQLARRQQRRSTRALRSGHSKVVNVDLSGLDPDTRQAFEVVARAFAAQMDFNRRMDVRHRRLEEALTSMDQRHERSEEEIAELRRRLERLEGDEG
jgi:hypothetical protein